MFCPIHLKHGWRQPDKCDALDQMGLLDRIFSDMHPLHFSGECGFVDRNWCTTGNSVTSSDVCWLP